MPNKTLPTATTSRPSLHRAEVSVNWSPDTIQRLLKLINDDDRYRRAFFPTDVIKYKVCDIARELCVELMEDGPEYMEMLEGRDQVIRDADGNWVPTDTWTSSYNNPVVTKFHDGLKKRYKIATISYNIRSSWTDFSQVSAGLRKDFRTSYPWFFMFKALVERHEPSPVPRPSITSASTNAASSSRQPQTTSTKTIVQAGPSTMAALPDTPTSSPFSNVRPTSSRPKPNCTASASMPSAPRPTVHTTNGAGSSSQIPIDIDLDSIASDEHQDDANRSNGIIDLTSPKPKKSRSKNKSFRTAHGRLNEDDKSNLKKLEKQLRIATFKKLEIRTTKVPKVFTHVSTERNNYMKAEDDVVKHEILRRARIHLIFRVLRDLDAFLSPKCLDNCGICIDRLFEMDRSARAGQLRRTVEQAGGTVYNVVSGFANDTDRSLRIYIYDDGQARGDSSGKVNLAENDQGLEHLEYTILEFGRFLRQRLFPTKK